MGVVRAIPATLAELFWLLWQHRLWWLIPMVIVLLLFAVIIVLGSTSSVGPLLYTLF